MSEGCCQQEVSERRAKPHFQGISPALWPRLTAIHGYCRREVSTRYCRDSWAMQEKTVFTQVYTGVPELHSGSTHRSAHGSWERSRDLINSDPHITPARPFILSSLPSHSLLSLPAPSLDRSFRLTHHVVSTQGWLTVHNHTGPGA